MPPTSSCSTGFPLENERLLKQVTPEKSGFHLVDFIAEVAMSEAFQSRLASMAPLRAASAASLALLGTGWLHLPKSAVFLCSGVRQVIAVREVLDLAERIDEVPRMDGMNTRANVTQATQQRTAALYQGNAAMNPPTDPAI